LRRKRVGLEGTLPKTNIAPEIGIPKRNVLFQPSIFRAYVSFRKGTCFSISMNVAGRVPSPND